MNRELLQKSLIFAEHVAAAAHIEGLDVAILVAVKRGTQKLVIGAPITQLLETSFDELDLLAEARLHDALDTLEVSTQIPQ